MTGHSKKEASYEMIMGFVILLSVLSIVFDQKYLLYAALAIGFICLLSKSVAGWFTFGWVKLLQLIGTINSRILLSLIFFLILTPIAFLSKIFKGSSLQTKKQEGSYFKETKRIYQAKEMENPW